MLEGLRNFLVLLPLALWLGGSVAVGFFVAPTVFGNLPRPQAGDIMTQIFAKLRWIEYFTIGALLLAEVIKFSAIPQLRGTRELWITGLIVAFLLVQIFSVAVVSPKIESIRANTENFDELPPEHPQRKAFGMWHGISMLCMLIGIGLGTAILLVQFVPPRIQTLP